MRSAILAVSLACSALSAAATDWFIDSAAGNDASAGTNADTAWKTLDAHNKSTVIAPGDRVLFKRGGLWRGTLFAKSGASGKPVLYSSYGAGPAEFAKYQSEMGMDAGSVYGEPQFVDEARRDYRLKPGTFGTAQATDGGPLGARNMPGLDADQSTSVSGN